MYMCYDYFACVYTLIKANNSYYIWNFEDIKL